MIRMRGGGAVYFDLKIDINRLLAVALAFERAMLAPKTHAVDANRIHDQSSLAFARNAA